MTLPRFDIGSWFLVPERLIRRPTGRQGIRTFASKPGRRPVILAEIGRGTVSTIVPRSTSSHQQRNMPYPHDKHYHPTMYPDCCIDSDGWVVNFQVSVPTGDLTGYGPKCAEPDNTGLLERIEQWVSI